MTSVNVPVGCSIATPCSSSVSCVSTPINSNGTSVQQKGSEAIGFVFADYNLSVEKFRNDSVDQLLRDVIISNSLVQRMPNVPDYKFLDSNDWPVLRLQEDKLSLFNLLTNESNVRIQMKRPEVSILDNVYRTGLVNEVGPSRQSDQGYGSDTTDHPNNLKIQDNIRSRSMEAPITFTSIDTIQLERTGSGKKKERKSSLNRKKGINGVKATIPKPIKSKSLAHPIMLSYARQEAAQHALDLKIELEKLGYSAYLDVHEITSGADWQDSLNFAVNNCVVFVPLVTPMYGNTQWTNREVIFLLSSSFFVFSISSSFFVFSIFSFFLFFRFSSFLFFIFSISPFLSILPFSHIFLVCVSLRISRLGEKE